MIYKLGSFGVIKLATLILALQSLLLSNAYFSVASAYFGILYILFASTKAKSQHSFEKKFYWDLRMRSEKKYSKNVGF